MDPVPDQQRAWVNVDHGIPSKALVKKNDWPVPKKLAPGEVLIKVHAAALNPVGYKLFKLLPNFVAGRPIVAEYDLSGVVVDSNGSRFKNGDYVYGWVPSKQFRMTDQGALCEYSRLHADWLVNLTPNVTPTQAAGVALTGLTAYEAIVSQANVQAGQRIFINGGSTSVGIYAIQLAKLRGARVTASASSKNEKFVRDLGADEFIDYRSVSLPTYLSKLATENKFDYIFDAAGLVDPSLYSYSGNYLSPMGMFVTVGPSPTGNWIDTLWNLGKTALFMILPSSLGGVKASYSIIVLRHRKECLEELQKYIGEGLVRPIVDSVFSFDNALKAYDRLMTGKAVGKVVVKVDPSID